MGGSHNRLRAVRIRLGTPDNMKGAIRIMMGAPANRMGAFGFMMGKSPYMMKKADWTCGAADG